MASGQAFDGNIFDDVEDNRAKTHRVDDWSAYEGVRTRRVLAFVLDYALIALAVLVASIPVAIFGVLTFGLGWMLFGILVPLVALTYIAVTLGGRHQATPGMRMMGIRLVREDGGRIDAMLAVVHSVMFWAFNTVLTPFILLATLVRVLLMSR